MRRPPVPAHAETTFKFRSIPCPECQGGGNVVSIARVTGEAFDADLYSRRCMECDGMRDVDAACADCLVVRPLDDDGFCEPCAMSSVLTTEEWTARYLHEEAMKAEVRL